MSTAPRASVSRVVRSVVAGLVLTLAVVLLLLWLTGVFHRKLPTAAPPAPAPSLAGRTLVEVRRIRVPAIESAVGAIRAVQQATISPEVLGKVVEVNMQAGQRVTKGDVLLRLDDEDFKARLRQTQAQVAAAQATRDQAETEYRRILGLHQRDAAADIELQRADAAFKEAEARLEQARQAERAAAKSLSYTTIVSPFDGIVIDKHVEVGDTVAPGKVLATIHDPTRMQLIASVREALVGRLHVDQSLEVRIEALQKTCPGMVTEIVPQADAATRTFLVKVSGPCDPDVKSGMFGRLMIPLDEEEWLVIPRAAVRRVGQLDMVDVADPDGARLQRRAVKLGRTRDAEVEVLAGLQTGERVALPPAAAGAGEP